MPIVIMLFLRIIKFQTVLLEYLKTASFFTIQLNSFLVKKFVFDFKKCIHDKVLIMLILSNFC